MGNKKARSTSQRNTANIWLTIGIILVLSAYHVAASMTDRLTMGLDSHYLPFMTYCRHALFFWLLILLWLAYRCWRQDRARQVRLTSVMSSITSDAILTVTPDRRITDCNEAIEAIFGYSTADIINRTSDLLYFDRRVAKGHEVFDSLNDIGFHVGKATGRRKDGTTMPLEIVTSPLAGSPGAVVMVRDVTAREQAQQAILESRDAAQAANQRTTEALEKLQESYTKLRELEQLRDNLTHMIVHDLKAPLSSVMVHLSMIKRAAVPPLNDRAAGHVAESTRMIMRLADMITTLLDVSRLEHGKMPLSLALHDLLLLCQEAATLVQPDADMKQVEIQLPSVPVKVMCDRDVMCRVIANLLSNSVKYTPSGGHVQIDVQDQNGHARVSVTDTGAGIPPEFHDKVFQQFAQVEAKDFSTGLGLTFCKLAVERHGGQIGVDSEIGKGSTFWFVLPTDGHPHDDA